MDKITKKSASMLDIQRNLDVQFRKFGSNCRSASFTSLETDFKDKHSKRTKIYKKSHIGAEIKHVTMNAFWDDLLMLMFFSYADSRDSCSEPGGSTNLNKPWS